MLSHSAIERRGLLAARHLLPTLGLVFSFSPLPLNAAAFSSQEPTLEEVVINARHAGESVRLVPIAIESFDSEQLRQLNVATLGDLSQYTSGLQFTPTAALSGSSNIATVYIRGIGQSDFLLTTDPGVGIYVDGVYLARNIGAVLSGSDLERIDIIKGPQGTLFGKNTPGGAISLSSTLPADSLEMLIRARTGSSDQRKVEFALDAPLVNKKLLSRISVVARQIDGEVTRIPDHEEQGKERRLAARASLHWLPTDDFTATLRIDTENNRDRSIASVLVASSREAMDAAVAAAVPAALYNNLIGVRKTLADGQSGEYDGRYLPQDKHSSFATGPNTSRLDTLGGSLSIHWDSPALAVKSISAYRDLSAQFGRDPDGSPLVIAETFNTVDHSQLSQELKLSSGAGNSWAGQLRWVAGVFYLREQGRDAVDLDFIPDLFPVAGLPFSIDGFYRAGSESLESYVHGTLAIGANMNVSAGLRYTSDTKRFRSAQLLRDTGELLLPTDPVKRRFQEVSPSASIEYIGSDDLLVFLNLGKGFKSGGFNARYNFPRDTVVEFDPEEVRSAELGFKWFSKAAGLRLDGSTFYSEYDDIQVQVIEGLTPFVRNAATAIVSGAEISMRAEFGNSLSLSWLGGYLDASITQADPSAVVSDGNRLPYSPRWNASIAIDYILPSAWTLPLQLHVDYSWRDRMAVDAVNTALLESPAVGLWNVRLLVKPAQSNWELALFGENLGDERYLIGGADGRAQVGGVEASFSRGREWGVEFSWAL